MDLGVLGLEPVPEQLEEQLEASGPETSAQPCQKTGPSLGWG